MRLFVCLLVCVVSFLHSIHHFSSVTLPFALIFFLLVLDLFIHFFSLTKNEIHFISKLFPIFCFQLVLNLLRIFLFFSFFLCRCCHEFIQQQQQPEIKKQIIKKQQQQKQNGKLKMQLKKINNEKYIEGVIILVVVVALVVVMLNSAARKKEKRIFVLFASKQKTMATTSQFNSI